MLSFRKRVAAISSKLDDHVRTGCLIFAVTKKAPNLSLQTILVS